MLTAVSLTPGFRPHQDSHDLGFLLTPSQDIRAAQESRVSSSQVGSWLSAQHKLRLKVAQGTGQLGQEGLLQQQHPIEGPHPRLGSQQVPEGQWSR